MRVSVEREIVVREHCEPVAGELPSEPTMSLGVDGTGVPMRKAATAGRVGNQADWSGELFKVKLVLVQSAEHLSAEGRPERDRGSVTHSGAIESAASRNTDAMAPELAH